MTQPPQNNQLNIKIDEKVGEGIYSNFFLISNNPSEVFIDFGRILPGLPEAKILSRIITTPQHAKQLVQILEKHLEQFEKQFGEIKVFGQQENRPIGFKTDGSSQS